MCCICQEKPITYGLLTGCSHVCCLQCIRGWREPGGKSPELVESGNTKKCPYCRTPSFFITPSSVFYPSGDPHKDATIQKYKASMARIPCKYFEQSMRRRCPFGRDCFYQHKNRDGTDHVFPFGADYYLKRSRQRRRNMFSNTDESTTPGLARALAALRQRLMAATLSDTNEQDGGAFGLLEDILTSFGSNPPDDPVSFSTALRVMSSIFDDDEDEDEDDDASIEDDDDELPPPLEPFSQVRGSPSRSGSPSPLPLTRSYMTSVATNRDPEPRPIVVNDPEDLGGVAVTTTVHIYHDDVEGPSSGRDGEGEEPYPMGEGSPSRMRTASGTDLSSLSYSRSAEAEYLSDQPPRPRSALPSYAVDGRDPYARPVMRSQILQQQQMLPCTSEALPPPVLQSPATGPTSSSIANVHIQNDGGGRSSNTQHPLIDASGTTATTTSSVNSDSTRSVDTNANTTSSSAIRKESRRERTKSERDRRSFVTDGRGRVVATAETDPDAAPSLFWTQPLMVPGHMMTGDESGTADSSSSNCVDAADTGPSTAGEAPCC